MSDSSLHRFEQGGRRFALDTETCFCFECDGVSWDVLEHYPSAPVNHIVHLLREQHPAREVEEVVGELEWLRSAKSILPALGPKERLKQFELQAEVREVDVLLPDRDLPSPDLVSGALALLLGRSGARKAITLRLHAPLRPAIAPALAAQVGRVFRDARLAGKELTVELSIPLSSRKDLAGHEIFGSLYLDERAPLDTLIGGLLAAGQIARLASLVNGVEGATAGVRIVPRAEKLKDVVALIQAEGLTRIDIDLPGAYQRQDRPEPARMLAELQGLAVYYAQELHRGNYFRLEPLAGTFRQIYEGQPSARADLSGSHALALDGAGDWYPSRYFTGDPAFRLGNLADGRIDEGVRAPFDDLGTVVTPECMSCWARNLCGGGHSAIHHALTGAIRRPDPAWCEAQRAWFSAAVAAFNLLTSHGVNFARLYQSLEPRKKPSLWRMARMALTVKAGVRPIEEGDAELLTRWENWSGAAYFLANEYGTLLATRYDREMDSLHPRGIEQELMIVSRRNEPLGLLKLRPEPRLNAARLWIFLADPAGYGDNGLRKSFREIIAQASGTADLSSLIAPAGPGDPGLGAFLEAVGFKRVGTERQALFLHDAWHDLDIYALRRD